MSSQYSMILFTKHLSKLIESFSKYDTEDSVKNFAWIQDFFHAQTTPEFTSQEEDSLDILLRQQA